MPTISVFIRKDDLDKWKKLENKSAWLHERLNNTVYKDKDYIIKENPKIIVEHNPEGDVAVGKLPEGGWGIKRTKPGYSLCKHGAAPELCKYAKPGKPCK